MSGHLFVLRGDVTRLNCDAWALPTDGRGFLEAGWRKYAPDQLRSDDAGILPLRDTYRRNLVEVGAAPVPDWPGCVVLDVGRNQPQEVQWYREKVDSFLGVAQQMAQVTQRERPLYALPLIGTRAAGGADIRGQIVPALLGRLEERLEDADFDVALVVFSAPMLAACQSVRRARGTRHDLSDDQLGEAGRIASLAADGRLVAFLGAGVSAGSGLPNWDDLLEQLAADQFSDSERRALAKLSLLDRARVISIRFKRDGLLLGQAVAQRLTGGRYGLLHGLLAGLPVTEYTTTNYDQLFEQAADAAGRNVKVLPYQRLEGLEPWLLKMHGCVTRPKEIVLTRDDFLNYAAERNALRGIVQALLITRHMLFVGFSLRDDNFLSITHDVRRALSAPEPPSEQPFGTLLALRQDDAREMLWQSDLITTHFGPRASSADAKEEAEADATASRKLEIFLDRVLLLSEASHRHVLDPYMQGSLSEDQERARQLLEPLQQAAREASIESPAWQRITAMLEEFGAREPSELERAQSFANRHQRRRR